MSLANYRALFVCICAGVLNLSSNARAGVVTLDSQSRFVLVTTDGLTTPSQTIKQTAPDFGPFDARVSSAQFAQPVQGALQTAQQSSQISVGSAGVAIDVSSAASAPNIALSGLPFQSYFDLQFTLSEPATFTGTYQSTAGSRYGLEPGVNSTFTGPGAPGVLQAPLPALPPTQLSGTLQPGSFEILANLQNVSGSSSDLDLHLTIAAVPLPPATWAALTALPLLAFAVYRMQGRRMK